MKQGDKNVTDSRFDCWPGNIFVFLHETLHEKGKAVCILWMVFWAAQTNSSVYSFLSSNQMSPQTHLISEMSQPSCVQTKWCNLKNPLMNFLTQIQRALKCKCDHSWALRWSGRVSLKSLTSHRLKASLCDEDIKPNIRAVCYSDIISTLSLAGSERFMFNSKSKDSLSSL